MQKAASKGSLKTLQLLLGRDGNDQHIVSTSLLHAQALDIQQTVVESGQLGTLMYLVEQTASRSNDDPGRFDMYDLSANGNKLLQVACARGHIDIVRYILQGDCRAGHVIFANVDPAVDDNSPLLLACMHGHVSIVRELLRKGPDGKQIYPAVDAKTRGNLPIKMAAEHGNLEVINFLLPWVVHSLDRDGVASVEKVLRNELDIPKAKENPDFLCGL